MLLLTLLLSRVFLTALPLLTPNPFYQDPGQEEAGSQGSGVVGEYLLTYANSQELPVVVSESGGDRQEVIGGSMVLEPDGGYVWTTRYRYSEGGRVSESESSGRGRYSLQGKTVLFSVEVGDDRLEGTLEDDTLTIRVDVPMVYLRSVQRTPEPGEPGSGTPAEESQRGGAGVASGCSLRSPARHPVSAQPAGRSLEARLGLAAVTGRPCTGGLVWVRHL